MDPETKSKRYLPDQTEPPDIDIGALGILAVEDKVQNRTTSETTEKVTVSILGIKTDSENIYGETVKLSEPFQSSNYKINLK